MSFSFTLGHYFLINCLMNPLTPRFQKNGIKIKIGFLVFYSRQSEIQVYIFLHVACAAILQMTVIHVTGEV